MKTLLTLVLAFFSLVVVARNLEVVEQDYVKARALAEEEGKLIFVDFYTTWCSPCKQLDKWVFRKDSIRKIMGTSVVLLRYDAERDSVHHLAKKYHIGSYPTGILLTPQGHVVKQQYGFRGEDEYALGTNVLEFIEAGLALAAQEQYVTGYSSSIEPDRYPAFYTDYVERTNIKPDPAIIRRYFEQASDRFEEPYFSVLAYFPSKVDSLTAEHFIANTSRYRDLYGVTDVSVLSSRLANAMFDRAIDTNRPAAYDAAKDFTRRALGQERLAEMLPGIELQYLQAQGDWKEFIARHAAAKAQGERSNGYLNHVSWTIYKECNDVDVMKTCTSWMAEVVAEEPSFDYLDTYAWLLIKAGDKVRGKAAAQQAIEAGKQEERKTAKLEALVEQL